MTFSTPFVIALLVCVAWTTFFSMFNRPGIRGYRNFGILATYVCLVVFIFRAEWKSVVSTWLIFAVAGGLIYTLWEIVQRIKTKMADKPKIGFMHFIPGVLTWPILIPEAIEYTLAELGVLKAPIKGSAASGPPDMGSPS